MLSEDELKEANLLVFANKSVGRNHVSISGENMDLTEVATQDQPSAMSESEVIEGLGLDTLKGRQWSIFKSCAIKGEGLEEGLDW